ncbi:MAG: FkbM family methyltransferase [Timaviella obliquedivisa GSE-PSE-MK23-08B]|jgi:FkbM family methyltransferase|nr:FkbM family methyltransferase [Timaviella obliquedivisa GSE-PSE-MK23-08B]
MNFSSFLYRRLSRWITCEFNVSSQSKISLKNKYEVASFNDVFCHPFYWQVFQWIQKPPKLVVDCGTHCGHFSILSDICIRSKFKTSDARYILIEPNPYLIPIIQKNLKNAGIQDRTFLNQALLGQKSGYGTLWINPKNFLATGIHQAVNTKPHEISYLDLSEVIEDEQSIDLMKIDIEGGEFEFIPAQIEILKRTNLVFMELHEATDDQHIRLFDHMKSAELHAVAPAVECHGQKLLIFQRQ